MYDYAAEPMWDRVWASLYYTTSTLTSTGYGDISPHSISEMFISTLMMIFGILFFSILMETLMRRFKDRDKLLDEISDKLKLLHELKTD